MRVSLVRTCVQPSHRPARTLTLSVRHGNAGPCIGNLRVLKRRGDGLCLMGNDCGKLQQTPRQRLLYWVARGGKGQGETGVNQGSDMTSRIR